MSQWGWGKALFPWFSCSKLQEILCYEACLVSQPLSLFLQISFFQIKKRKIMPQPLSIAIVGLGHRSVRHAGRHILQGASEGLWKL